MRELRRGALAALLVLAAAGPVGAAAAVSAEPAGGAGLEAPEPGPARVRLTLRGGQVRNLQSLRRLPDGRVRLHLVEGGLLEVDEIWILDWEYSPGYLEELAQGDGAIPAACDPRDSPRIGRWDELIASKAGEHGLAPALVRAVIAVESCGDPEAISSAGAVGLMQLMPGTADMLGCADRRDPAANVEAGCRYLRRVLTRFDEDLELGLAAYHAGEGAVARHRRVPPYPSTLRYVKLVTTQLALLQRLARPFGPAGGG